MRRLMFRPLVLVSTFALGLFVTFLLTSAGDALSRLLYEPSVTIPTLCRGVRGDEPLPCAQPDLREAEEAAVYSALIEPIYVRNAGRPVAAPEVVIQDQTTQGNYLLIGIAEYQSLEGMFEALKRDFPLADRATLDSFLAVNNQRHSMLRHPFLARTRSRLIGHEEVEGFYKTGPGSWWTGFYRKYPNASGFFTFSKVGFNPDMTQALVYRAFACNDTCGYSSYVLLVKEEGVWRIVGQGWQAVS
ncbi:MAG TPA: hypothetical protein VF544_14605 [Pyrinomonadaceae bacterium]|jgi:hypothetical protein